MVILKLLALIVLILVIQGSDVSKGDVITETKIADSHTIITSDQPKIPFHFLFSKDMRDSGEFAHIASDPFSGGGVSERFFIAVNDPNGGSLLRVTRGMYTIWDDRIMLNEEEAIVETMNIINFKDKQYCIIISVAPSVDKTGVRVRDPGITESTLTRRIIRIDIDEQGMNRTAQCELVFQGHGSNKHKAILFSPEPEPNKHIVMLSIVGNTNLETHELNIMTMKTTMKREGPLPSEFGFSFNAARSKYSTSKEIGKYWFLYEDRPSNNPTIIIWEKRNIELAMTLRVLPDHAVSGAFFRIVAIFPEYGEKDTTVLHIAFSGYDPDGFRTPACVTRYYLESLNPVASNVTCVENSFFAAAHHNGSIALAQEHHISGSEAQSYWEFSFYDMKNNRIWRRERSPTLDSFGLIDRSAIRNLVYGENGLTVMLGRDTQADPRYGTGRMFNKMIDVYPGKFSYFLGAFSSIADIVQRVLLLSTNNHLSDRRENDKREYQVMLAIHFLGFNIIRLAHATIIDDHQQASISAPDSSNDTISLTTYSPETFVLNTTNRVIPKFQKSIYFYSKQRREIYLVNADVSSGSVMMLVFSFDYELRKTVYIPIPASVIISSFKSFALFKDKREEVVVFLGTVNSNDVLVYINIVSLQFEGSSLELNSGGKYVQCGTLREKSLFMVASPKTETRECTFYSQSLKDPTKYATYIINNTKGIDDCRVHYCLVDEYKRYMYLSTKSGLVQLDIRSDPPQITSVQPIRRMYTSAIFDSRNGKALFFSEIDGTAAQGTQFSSTIYAFNIPVYIPKQLSRAINWKLMSLIIVPVLFLLIVIPLTICLLIQGSILRKKKKAATEMEQLLLDNHYRGAESDSSDTDKWLINIEDIKFESKLSEGASGVVMRGRWKNIAVAVKKMKIDSEDSTAFIHEARTLINLRHIHVLLFLGICVHDNHRFIVTELLDNGSLDKFLRGKFHLPFAEKIRILTEVASAMIYLHSLQPCLIHRDLKPQNILLDKHMQAKVGDFGLSKTYEGSGNMTGYIGTFLYMAPEILESRDDYDMSCDVYSFSMIMYEVLFEAVPFLRENCNMYTLGGSILHGKRPMIDFVTSDPLDQKIVFDQNKLTEWCSSKQKYPEALVKRYVKLMVDCWQSDQHARPSFLKVHQIMEQIHEKLV